MVWCGVAAPAERGGGQGAHAGARQEPRQALRRARRLSAPLPPRSPHSRELCSSVPSTRLCRTPVIRAHPALIRSKLISFLYRLRTISVYIYLELPTIFQKCSFIQTQLNWTNRSCMMIFYACGD